MFHKTIIIWYLIFLIAFIAVQIIKAQQVRQFTAEQVQAGARATALADAYISDPRDVSSFYWNPASLAFIQTYSISGNSIISWDNTTFKTAIAAPYRVDDLQTVALGGAANYQGYFSFFSLDLGYARKLSPAVSAGIFFDIGYAASRSKQLGRGSGSLGILYSPSQNVSYALVYRGFGKDVRYHLYYGDQENLEYVNPQRALLVGSTFWFPTKRRQPYLSISLTAEKNFGIDKFTSKVGIEIWPLTFAAIRLGVLSKPSVAVGRAGWGLYIDRFLIDYAISSSTAEERTHQLSVAVRL